MIVLVIRPHRHSSHGYFRDFDSGRWTNDTAASRDSKFQYVSDDRGNKPNRRVLWIHVDGKASWKPRFSVFKVGVTGLNFLFGFTSNGSYRDVDNLYDAVDYSDCMRIRNLSNEPFIYIFYQGFPPQNYLLQCVSRYQLVNLTVGNVLSKIRH